VNEQVFDLGLPAERTALAWRRTALTMATAALGLAHLAGPGVGIAGAGMGVAGLAQAILVAYTARSRYRDTPRSLIEHTDRGGLVQPGLSIAWLAMSGMSVGLLALALVLHGTN
jgi:uncharacterized membrane protein YidH (DUF202 family)